jgi:hypothetical protein
MISDMHIPDEWIIRMAEKEGNGIISVGGLVSKMGHNCHQCLVHLDPEDVVYTWYQDKDAVYCSIECRTKEILALEAKNDPKSD